MSEALTEARVRDGNAPLPFPRDELGRMVREAWVRWAKTQPSPKPSWLVPYEELSEPDKEADRQIGEAIARWTIIGMASALGTAPAVGVSVEAIARIICGPDSDTPYNGKDVDEPMPRWQLYEGMARKIAALYASPAPATAAEIRALDALIEELKRHDTFVFGGNASQQGGVGIMKEQMIKRLSAIRALSEGSANGK